MVVRDVGWIDREYNQEKWPELLEMAEGLVAAGERSMPRLLSLLELQQHKNSRYLIDGHIRYFQPKLGSSDKDVGNRDEHSPAETYSAPLESAAYAQRVDIPFAAAFEGFAGMVARTICSICRPETGCVVELGSGYGRFLFRVWLSGGPVDAPYFALEFTESGRRCTQAIGNLEPGMDLNVHPFDYNNPDYSVLPSELDHAVVFSCQSVEQVPVLKKEALTGLFGVAREVTCLHFEPVGWQLDEKDRKPGAGASSEAYAREHDYNRNLWPLLKELQNEDRIRIDRVEAEVFGIVPENCVSIIGWTKTG